MSKNYYDILGIERSASGEEIKKAFHKLAHKYHPDKKGGDESKFKEINEAYQILSDDSKRSQYDAYGDAGANFSGQQQGGFGSGFDFSNFAGQNGQGFQFDLGDLFGDMFGGQRGGGRGEKRGRDISVDIQISFTESVFGAERKVLINKIGVCDTCKGNGAAAGAKLVTCKTCAGKGQIQEARRSFLGTFTTARECSSCSGSGEVPEKACATCSGRGVLKKTEELQIVIPAGMENGEMIRMSNKGEAVTRGVSGDLYVRVHVEIHPVFRRDGLNLTMDLSVRLTDALLGTESEIETLDGKLKVKIPEGITYGEILRVKNRGIPDRNNKRGDLLIRVLVKTSNKLSKKAKTLIEELKKEGI